MKYLLALSFAQAILLAFLGARLLEIDTRTINIARHAQAIGSVSGQIALPQTSIQPVVRSGADATQIRTIIREELAVLGSDVSRPTKSGARRTTSESTAPDPRRSEDSARIKTAVTQDIDYYIGQGKINDTEMAGLQMKMAQLPDTERQKMLITLTKAMNSGDLKGHF